MADDDIIIGGIGQPGRIPDFATEATQKSINEEAAKHGAAFTKMVRLLSMQASGQKISQGEYKNIQKELRLSRKETEKAKNQEGANSTRKRKQDEVALNEDKKQTNIFKKLLIASGEHLALENKRFKEDLKNNKKMQQLMKEGMSEESAGIMAKLAGFAAAVGTIGTKFAPVVGAITAAAAAVKGANEYLTQQAADRFNLAQELRQSGLASGLSSSEASLTSFAAKVRENNFTLGEAAEFTQRFANSVGVLGVQSSLEFVNSLAYAGENGSDMMRKFGMEFGEVANVAGTYLDSVRNLGMLDRMNAQQLRTNMDDFMSTVVSTSNVMKINMEDAAQMIKETLGRSDISSLLATMDPQRAAQVQEVVGMAGGMDNAMGEALAMRLAAGSQQEFMMTDAYANLVSDPISASIMPLVEQLATATEQGGVSGFQAQFANSEGQIQEFMDYASANREILLTGESAAQELVASLNRIRATVDDADDGRQALSGDDSAVLGSIEATRRFALALEGINTEIVENIDLETNLGRLNDANLALSGSIEEGASAIAATTADFIASTTFGAEAITKELAAGGLDIANEHIFGNLSDDSRESLENVKRMRQVIEQTFGAESLESISRPILEQIQKIQDLESNETSPYNTSRLGAERSRLIDMIDELSLTNPEQAERLSRELPSIQGFARDGTRLEFNPEELARQGMSFPTRTGVVQQRSGFLGGGDYELAGGGTMETRDMASDRVFAGLNANSSLDSDFIKDAFESALRSDGAAMLQSAGFGDSNDQFTVEEQQFMTSMLQQIKDNNLLNQEQLTQLVESTRNATGNEGWFDMSEATAADNAQRRQLISAIGNLVDALNN